MKISPIDPSLIHHFSYFLTMAEIKSKENFISTEMLETFISKSSPIFSCNGAVFMEKIL